MKLSFPFSLPLFLKDDLNVQIEVAMPIMSLSILKLSVHLQDKQNFYIQK